MSRWFLLASFLVCAACSTPSAFAQKLDDIESTYKSRIGTWKGQAELVGLGGDLAEAHYSWVYGRHVVSASYRVLSYLELYNEHMLLVSWDAKQKKITGTNFGNQGRLGQGIVSVKDGVITTTFETPGPNGEFSIVDRIDGKKLLLTGYAKDGKTALWNYTFTKADD